MNVPWRAPLRRFRQASLIRRFAVLSLLPIVGLAAILVPTMTQSVNENTTNTTRQAAEFVARLGVQPHLDASDLERGLSDRQLDALDDALAAEIASGTIVRVKVWRKDGTVVYSDDRSIIGRKFRKGPLFHQVLRTGRAVTELETEEQENASERSDVQLMEVYAPLKLDRGDKPVGVFEIYLPYQPVADSIRQSQQRLLLILATGLAVLWLSLHRIVGSASRKLQEQADQNEYLATHDALTGLPNRSLFFERAEAALDAGQGRGALLLIDLDRFKEVNDTLGHGNGDDLLRQVARRLRDTADPSHCVARLGGDEFAVLVPGCDADGAATQAARYDAALRRDAFSIGGMAIRTSGSVGAAVYPDHGTEVADVTQAADLAMYAAKAGTGDGHVYTPLGDGTRTRVQSVLELQDAIMKGGLTVFYQPKADLATGAVSGAEALVRWLDATGKPVMRPDELVQLAIEQGLLTPLTSLVLRDAIRQGSRWHSGGRDLVVSVNIALTNLLDAGFVNEVEELLLEHRLPGSLLKLELTETGFLSHVTKPSDAAMALKALGDLRELGVQLSLDDFGMGYSSLANLRRFPFHEIKVDRSFVLQMLSDETDASIVAGVVQLGKSLGMTVVAEGVETVASWERLAGLGCDVAQGFLLSQPVAPHEFDAWLERYEGDEEQRIAA